MQNNTAYTQNQHSSQTETVLIGMVTREDKTTCYVRIAGYRSYKHGAPIIDLYVEGVKFVTFAKFVRVLDGKRTVSCVNADFNTWEFVTLDLDSVRRV